MATSVTNADLTRLERLGFVHIGGPFASIAGAWDAAESLINAATASDTALEVLGEFVIPPVSGPPSRDFQTLHHDFGLPLAPAAPADTARFTALHVTAAAPASNALTRLVPLRPLLAGYAWPDRDELVRRFKHYGDTHGAWENTAGYIEGSLARIVEAALSQPPVLPSVKDPGFLCGNEFVDIEAEVEFFTCRGLHVDTVGVEIALRPGELLVFDNLMLAHGRRGIRHPGELHQRVFGHPLLTVDKQLELRDRVLTAFNPSAPHNNQAVNS